MRFTCFSLFLAVLIMNGSVFAQAVQAPRPGIAARVYVPTETEFKQLTPEEQRAFQSVGVTPVADVKQTPRAAESGKTSTAAAVNPKVPDAAQTKKIPAPAPRSK